MIHLLRHFKSNLSRVTFHSHCVLCLSKRQPHASRGSHQKSMACPVVLSSPFTLTPPVKESGCAPLLPMATASTWYHRPSWTLRLSSRNASSLCNYVLGTSHRLPVFCSTGPATRTILFFVCVIILILCLLFKLLQMSPFTLPIAHPHWALSSIPVFL